MRASILLIILCSQIRLIFAFAEAGAYERAWFWYCYELDGANPNPTIARTCRGSAPQKRCTFAEFLLHINLGDDIIKRPLEKVDTKDLARTAQAVSDAHATGPFNANQIFEGRINQNDAKGTYERMHTWMKTNKDRLASLSTPGKANMRMATMTVAKVRMGKLADHLSIWFGEHDAFLSRTSKSIFEGSTDTVSYADRERTITDHPTLSDGERYDELVKEFETKDPNHAANVRIMRSAAKTAFESCS